MQYLANPKRADPKLILPTAQSVICVGLVYNADLPYSTEIWSSRQHARPGEDGRETRDRNSELRISSKTATSEACAWVSRYAWGRDYHMVMKSKLDQLRRHIDCLAPGSQTRVYVDTGPIVERAFARFSGIGWMGKNTCLINESKGSWFFLGVILTSLALQQDMPAPDRCGSCTRCLDACPTGALTRPYVMDASRCIAYLTIEKKGSMPVEFRPAIGLNVFGCDICQDVCPWNSRRQRHRSSGLSDQRVPRGVAVTDRPEFQPLRIETGKSSGAVNADPEAGGKRKDVTASDTRDQEAASVSLFNPPLRALASLDEEGFRHAFSRSPVKRAKYRGWLRNVCVVMANSGDMSFVPWLERACRHEDAVVREHASWALARLRKPPRKCRSKL
jgi:epoxyqueuosine reductase